MPDTETLVSLSMNPIQAMVTSNMNFESQSKKIKDYKIILIYLSLFFLYLLLRLFAWQNTVLLEDTDSLFYLDNIKVFLTFDLHKIINLDPDSTPFYPFFGALFSLPGWSVESAARLTSLFFSSVLFLAVLGIGKQTAKPLEITLGLLILSFSPVLISLSFSVLTEPSYVATIYLGFWFFWTQYRKPKLWKAAVLGVIFGLAFLNRLEGILYLCIIPFLQGSYEFLWGRNKSSFKQFLSWSSIFITCFSLMAIPQVWRVSHKMGTFAINGRQVWSLVLNAPDEKSGMEKIFGLDFSPSQINIGYIKSHPEVLNQFESKTSPTDYIKTVIKEFDHLYRKQLGILIGPFGLIFFGFGILALYQSKRRFEIFLILAFISLNMVGPLLHNVVIRHIIIIAPIIFLTEGVGIVYLNRILLQGHERYFLAKHVLPFIFLFGLIGSWGLPLLKSFRPPDYNHEYSPAELREPIAIVKEMEENELQRTPIIASERGYLAHFVEGKQVYLPYTDYEGLVKFCELNNVDVCYLKHKRVAKYPFFQAFSKNKTNIDFVLLYSGLDTHGEKLELYRFRKKQTFSSKNEDAL